MAAPNANGNNQQQPRTVKKSGNPLGCLLTLLLLLGAGAGLYYLWQNKQGGEGAGFMSSLNLPGLNNSQNNAGSSNPSSNDGGFSQTAPINYQQGQNAGTNSSNNSRRSSGNKTANKATKKTANPNLVPSGYPLVAPPNPLPAEQPSNNKLIDSQIMIPKVGLVPGSFESLIAYPEANGNPLAVKPSQIITFQTNYYNKVQALSYATQKLKASHFGAVQIQIDDYERGGSTVIEGRDNKGNQALISFKPVPEFHGTAWKIEAYKAK